MESTDIIRKQYEGIKDRTADMLEMSNNGAFDEENKKRSSDDEDSQGTKILKSEDAVVEQQPQKPEEETMDPDLLECLNDTVEISKVFRRRRTTLRLMSIQKGLLLRGKPDLGPRVEKYLELHCNDIAFIFYRDLLNLSTSKCDDTFQRAACCEPSIVLLIGLEHADGDMEQMIARNIKEMSEYGAMVLVVGTIATSAPVSKKLKESFGVIDLQELALPKPV